MEHGAERNVMSIQYLLNFLDGNSAIIIDIGLGEDVIGLISSQVGTHNFEELIEVVMVELYFP